MSRVTNVILTADVGPSDSDIEIEAVNKFLRAAADGGGGGFIDLTAHAGGYKHMEFACICRRSTMRIRT